MKKILFDLMATQPGIGKFHGGGEYAKTVFLKVIEEKKNEEITAFYDPSVELDPKLMNVAKGTRVKLVTIEDKAKLPTYTKENSFDIFYSAITGGYCNIELAVPKVIFTIHDTRPIDLVWDKYRYKYTKNILSIPKGIVKKIMNKRYRRFKKKRLSKLFEKGDETKVIVPSLYTKYSLKYHLPGIECESIKVLYSPEVDNFKSVNLSIEREKNLLNRYGLKKERYFLITGAKKWFKNSYRAIKAIDEGYCQGSIDNSFKTIVLGYDGNLNFEKELRNTGNFIFEGYLSFENLSYLYKNAFAFIYPTLNEGFGYPPLESMQFGTPVLSSNMGSIPEICGDAVMYFNPYSISEINKRLITLFNEESLRDKLVKKGEERIKYISNLQSTMLNEMADIILERQNDQQRAHV